MLNKIKSIHFTGIKGVGMTPLALCALDLKKKVTGSDTDEVFPTDKVLKKRGIKVKVGFKAKNLPKKLDLLIYTGAHGGSTNLEVTTAKDRGIPTLNLAQGLQLFTQNKQVLAVAGVGGKSSTSAMLAVVLNSAGLKPSFSVGVGNISNLETPGRFVKKSKVFIVEADEYVADPTADQTPRFHYLNPSMAILTNIEHDHPDVYPSLDDIFATYKTFISRVPDNGTIIVNQDNKNIKQFIKKINRPVITYGFSPQSDWQIIKVHQADQKQFFSLKHCGIEWPQMILNVPGNYNIQNATATVIAAHQLGVKPDKIKVGLKKFIGSSRRFELMGQVKGILFYDDYAHHPIEIKAMLKAAKNWLPGRRIIAIFQSHTYSRTKALLTEFSKSFDSADIVLINDIFSSAREVDNLGLTGKIFTQEVKKYHPKVNYCSGKKQTIDYLVNHALKGDVVFTIGAGNNWLWHKDIIKAIKTR
ncbi:MAG: UDP-N-acetylmuramate--L-alanine ligase [Candidatus Beckwithbacteria bacterium]|nr:UDP-N-acetylmuramate--L-alanine ligase [Patescibacteria group bacterium]